MHADPERRLLTALCQAATDAATRSAILQTLKTHAFADPDHQAIFRALTQLPIVDPASLRQALTQAVTRMGFPDVDVEWLFTEHPPAPDEIPGLLNLLPQK
jgi:hypothetical protein